MAHRRRDLRFRVLPYDALQIVNAGVVFATLIAILVVVFDPLLVAWQEKLPDALVTFFRYVTRFGKSDWILIGTGLFLILMLRARRGGAPRAPSRTAGGSLARRVLRVRLGRNLRASSPMSANT